MKLTGLKRSIKMQTSTVGQDRRENCEYAVLVSMLEADNDYFNTGIVDVSHEYEKMCCRSSSVLLSS